MLREIVIFLKHQILDVQKLLFLVLTVMVDKIRISSWVKFLPKIDDT